MVKVNIKASLNDRQIASTLMTTYRNFFGPSLPLGQKRLRQYLHKTRWEILYYIDGAFCVILYFSKNPITFEMSDFYLSLNEKDKFSETYLSFSFTYIIYHDSLIKIMTFMTAFRFSINPLGKLPLLTCDSQYTGYALWRSIGLTFDAWKICNCLIRDMIP